MNARGEYGSEAFYGGQYVPYHQHQLDTVLAGPSQGLTDSMQLQWHADLETFRNDVYSGLGFEHTPTAEKIVELLGAYVKLRAAGKLYDHPPPAISQPSRSSESSQEPSEVSRYSTPSKYISQGIQCVSPVKPLVMVLTLPSGPPASGITAASPSTFLRRRSRHTYWNTTARMLPYPKTNGTRLRRG